MITKKKNNLSKDKNTWRAVKIPAIDLSAYEFTIPTNGLMDLLLKLGGINAWKSPIHTQTKTKRKWNVLTDYGRLLGFSDAQSNNVLKNADSRSGKYAIVVILIYAIVAISLSTLLNYVLGYLSSNSGQTANRISEWSISFIIAIIIVLVLFIIIPTYIFAIIGIRLGTIPADAYFSDVLCIRQSFYIVFELQQEDILRQPEKKKRLLERVDYLARKVPLLDFNYSSEDAAIKGWSRQHFRKIERYIREREKWIIAPQPSTLSVLRSDFYALANVFVSGNYGEIDWEKELPVVQEPSQTLFQKIEGGLTRFIGIALPTSMIVAMFLFPEQYKFLELDHQTISAVAFAWLILALDVNLKLGIVERLVDLAKAIKNL